MPNEVGKGLQIAQDHLQIVSGNPLYFSLSEDALRLGRLQINDANWQVCSQTPAPGARVDESTTVTLFAVKLSEECP